jgi:molybdate transport system substrate-binding protein
METFPSEAARHARTRICRLAPLILAAACSQPTLIVFAAASLTDAVTEVGTLMEQQEPGLNVRFNFAGSPQLATQIEHGAPADVYLTANSAWMDYLSERNVVGQSAAFASTDLALLAGSSIGFEDIARPGMQIVVGAETVPIGQYTRLFLERLEQATEFGPIFVNAVRDNIVSEEDNVRAVVAKVLAGEADVGFVYRTELARLRRGGVFAVPVPPRYNVKAQYFAATVHSAEHAEAAQRFVRLLAGDEARAVLERHGFGGGGT